MYEELVKALHYCGSEDRCKGCPRENAKTKCYDDICIEAADAIEELQADKAALNGAFTNLLEQIKDHGKPRWIPVTERLPEDDSDVLCWYEYYHWSAEKVLPEYGIGQWCNGFWGGEVSNGRDCKVLAWMPLPEPPKGEA